MTVRAFAISVHRLLRIRTLQMGGENRYPKSSATSDMFMSFFVVLGEFEYQFHSASHAVDLYISCIDEVWLFIPAHQH